MSETIKIISKYDVFLWKIIYRQKKDPVSRKKIRIMKLEHFFRTYEFRLFEKRGIRVNLKPENSVLSLSFIIPNLKAKLHS